VALSPLEHQEVPLEEDVLAVPIYLKEPVSRFTTTLSYSTCAFYAYKLVIDTISNPAISALCMKPFMATDYYYVDDALPCHNLFSLFPIFLFRFFDSPSNFKNSKPLFLKQMV
jgi:hypothetical protein